MVEPLESSRAKSLLNRWVVRGALLLVAIVVVGYGLILFYARVLNDAPAEFSGGDLAAAITTDVSTPPNSMAASSTADATTTDATTAELKTVSGNNWVATDASELGYRVKESLFGASTEAVGRTNLVTGAITIDSSTLTAATFIVDIASIKSDDSRRDAQFVGRIMSADDFPTASFILAEPIDLGPELDDGAELKVIAIGDLTLRGVTNRVSFELTATKSSGTIGVFGSITVTFADYSIANPSFGGVSTEDRGLLEFVLIFEPA